MEKKLQIFVSSTYTDLIKERQAAVEAILIAGHIPAGMELFTAGDQTQMEVIKKWIDDSDIYLLILGGRYGSVENKTNKSYTHLEYEYAVKAKKPMFSVIISDDALDKLQRQSLEQVNQKELTKFREDVSKKIVRFWSDTKDIKLAIHETLPKFAERENLIGWVRPDKNLNPGLVAQQLANLTKENSDLKNEIIKLKDTEDVYFGLTISQIENLLKKELIDEGALVKKSIFDFFLEESAKLLSGARYESKNIAIQKLKDFKLANVKNVTPAVSEVSLSDEGHRLLIKFLSEK